LDEGIQNNMFNPQSVEEILNDENEELVERRLPPIRHLSAS
jgi:hypothetical protein